MNSVLGSQVTDYMKSSVYFLQDPILVFVDSRQKEGKEAESYVLSSLAHSC